MIEITYVQLLIGITLLWILTRLIVGVKNKRFSIKRELQLLLVYICIIVIARFVYFGFHLEHGRLSTMKFGLDEDSDVVYSLIPFFFLVDRYDGWLMNIIGNITMFIPVGIVWPVCFKKLDAIWKTVLAGAGFTLFIEVSQLLCPERHTDIDDLILNTIGVLIGALIVFGIRKCKKEKV